MSDMERALYIAIHMVDTRMSFTGHQYRISFSILNLAVSSKLQDQIYRRHKNRSIASFYKSDEAYAINWIVDALLEGYSVGIGGRPLSQIYTLERGSKVETVPSRVPK